MPILYKGITAVLAVTGCASLLITGSMNLLMCLGGLMLFPGYYRFFRGYPHVSRRAAAILSQAALFVFLADASVITGDIFLAVGHMTITFQGIKSFDLKEPWDHLQVYFMALLQLIIASELTRSLAFGVIFVIFMVLLVTAMILSHFLKEGSLGLVSIRRPVFIIVLLSMISTTLFFIALPRSPQRFPGKSHSRGIKTAGFSDTVDFGSFGEVKLDPTIVMRIELHRELPRPYYWRGTAMDYFDNKSWRNTGKEKNRVQRTGDEFLLSPYDKAAATEQRIYLEPIDSDVLFGLSKVAALSVDAASLTTDADAGIFMPGRFSRRITYTVHSDTYSFQRGKKEQRYLQLPDKMERIVSLAKDITDKAVGDVQKASLIEEYLKRNHVYSLTATKPPAGTGVIEEFLFNSKKGYCEHYAASMALMLRGIGIPSRIVTGFFGGEKNEYGDYLIVRQSDAHAWVEALIDGQWRRFDPTPAVSGQRPAAIALFLDSLRLQWTRYVVGFSADDQREIVRGLSSPFSLKIPLRLPAAGAVRILFAIITVFAISGALVFLLKRKRRRRYDPATILYLEFRRLLRKQGTRLTDSMTSGDIRRLFSGLEAGEIIDEFLEIYERHRFGNIMMDDQMKSRLRGLLKKLKKKESS